VSPGRTNVSAAVVLAPLFDQVDMIEQSVPFVGELSRKLSVSDNMCSIYDLDSESSICVRYVTITPVYHSRGS